MTTTSQRGGATEPLTDQEIADIEARWDWELCTVIGKDADGIPKLIAEVKRLRVFEKFCQSGNIPPGAFEHNSVEAVMDAAKDSLRAENERLRALVADLESLRGNVNPFEVELVAKTETARLRNIESAAKVVVSAVDSKDDSNLMSACWALCDVVGP